MESENNLENFVRLIIKEKSDFTNYYSISDVFQRVSIKYSVKIVEDLYKNTSFAA